MKVNDQLLSPREEWVQNLNSYNVISELRKYKQGLIGERRWYSVWDAENQRYRSESYWVPGFGRLAVKKREKKR